MLHRHHHHHHHHCHQVFRDRFFSPLHVDRVLQPFLVFLSSPPLLITCWLTDWLTLLRWLNAWRLFETGSLSNPAISLSCPFRYARIWWRLNGSLFLSWDTTILLVVLRSLWLSSLIRGRWALTCLEMYLLFRQTCFCFLLSSFTFYSTPLSFTFYLTPLFRFLFCLIIIASLEEREQ